MANSLICNTTTNQLSTNFSGNTVNLGEIWTVVESRGRNFCVEIIDLTDDPVSTFSASTLHTDCYDCFIDNYGVYIFSVCGVKGQTYIIDGSEFGATFYYSSSGFTNSTTFYLEFLVNGQLVQGCFSYSGSKIQTFQDYQKLLDTPTFSQTLSSYTPQIDCQTCITTSSLVYRINPCLGQDIVFVALPSSILLGSVISYTDGIDEFCGSVLSAITTTTTHTFVTDFGRVECLTCLEVVNTKYRINNCLDSEVSYVVYGSQLFQSGQVSNLSFNEGCFEVSGTTTDPVDLNLFFDYEPHTDCTECLECSGVFYQYSLCSDVDNVIVGEILSYQVIPVGGLFFHPFHNEYCRRQTASNSPSGVYDTFYSVRLANNCDDDLPQFLEASECADGFSTIVMIDATVGIGNIVQGMWASNNLFCLETTGFPLINSGSTYFNTANNGFGTTLIYDLCTTCYNNTNVGVKTINCDTSLLQNYDVSYLEWCTLTNFGGFGSLGYSNLCFSDSLLVCRTILECPATLSGNLLEPINLYFNCPFCRIFNPIPEPEPPRSAGTEYNVCVICCDCGASGSTVTQVSPPHPVWTDGYGTSVTQINMVTLGGMFGLNN